MTPITIVAKFSIGQTAYLKTDTDQKCRLVTAITLRAQGWLVYELSCGTGSSWHNEIEISETKDNLIGVTQ